MNKLIYSFLFLFFTFSWETVSLAHTLEKHITIIVAGYNNKQWYQKNLDSILSQNYENYNVIYVDDCSPDGTYELVKMYVDKSKKREKFTIVKNSFREHALSNYYKSIHTCGNTSIIVLLDADDWFAHADVLSSINEIYAKNNIWLTYGQYKRFPSGAIGHGALLSKDIIKRAAFREVFPFPFTAPRTFYAWLFKKIDKQDLLDQNGNFFEMAYDVAIMMPMVEMARHHFMFLPEVAYVYNTVTPINDHKKSRKKQHETSVYIRENQKRYLPIEN